MTEDYRCCTRIPTHDGPCEWICGPCAGTGRCPECDGDGGWDDVDHCEWCDGTGRCLDGCDYGIKRDDAYPIHAGAERVRQVLATKDQQGGEQ